MKAPEKNSAATPACWLAYCRAGFEPDLAAEFAAIAGKSARVVTATAESGFAHVGFDAGMARALEGKFNWSQMIFARQCVRSQLADVSLPTNDRVTPIVAAARAFLPDMSSGPVSKILLEYPDTNEGKAQSKLAQAIQPLIAEQLRGAGLLDAHANTDAVLHVLLLPDRRALLGYGHAASTSPWHNGIARLRMPHDAPSRSTLKLAEAFHVFLAGEEERLLTPEMRAVDLGAAPGGWTWQLINRGLHVTAVDNGPLKGDLLDNALVRHLREDGFRYRPRKPVDWMVCDMVEKPVRVAQLVAAWFREGWTERCIFNLKLPMKKRLDEIRRCESIIAEAMEANGRRFELRFKQLYHDREEVTGFCRYLPRTSRR
jgi:23S rRNA (cytidine2498-2'-O)-methyltransferase